MYIYATQFLETPRYAFCPNSSQTRFLLKERHLISGLPFEKREDLGERFVAALASKRPDLNVKAIVDSSRPCKVRGQTAEEVQSGASTTGDAENSSDASASVSGRTAGVQCGTKRLKLWETLKGEVNNDPWEAGRVCRSRTDSVDAGKNGDSHQNTEQKVGASAAEVSSEFRFGFSFA